MRNLTASQSYANPYIRSKKDTVLISPSLTGKTIAYLLPLLDSKQSKDVSKLTTMWYCEYRLPYFYYKFNNVAHIMLVFIKPAHLTFN